MGLIDSSLEEPASSLRERLNTLFNGRLCQKVRVNVSFLRSDEK